MTKGSRTRRFLRFWRFVTALYGDGGVQPACLLLQDRHGLDVTLLLYLAWAAPLTGTEIRVADRAVRRWRRQVVGPLRRARRDAPAGSDVRAAALRAEIAAERHAAALLADLDQGSGGKIAPAVGTGPTLDAYAAAFAAPRLGPRGRAALAAVTAAADQRRGRLPPGVAPQRRTSPASRSKRSSTRPTE